MKNSSKKTTKESSIQTAISEALTENGWFVVKIMMASKNGIPDLMAIKNGRTIFIEVKNEDEIVEVVRSCVTALIKIIYNFL